MAAENSPYILCFTCSHVFRTKRNCQNTCPLCGSRVDPEAYRRIMTYAAYLVYYGFDYRRAYEKQIAAEGRITTRYSLPDSATLLCFCGAAALSGVIGGFAYDVVKRAIRGVVKQAKSMKTNIGQSIVCLDTEDEVDAFVRYLQQDHSDRRALDEAVLWEIQKEEVICRTSHCAALIISRNPKVTKEEIIDALQKTARQTTEIEEPMRQDFEDFWKELPKQSG